MDEHSIRNFEQLHGVITKLTRARELFCQIHSIKSSSWKTLEHRHELSQFKKNNLRKFWTNAEGLDLFVWKLRKRNTDKKRVSVFVFSCKQRKTEKRNANGRWKVESSSDPENRNYTQTPYSHTHTTTLYSTHNSYPNYTRWFENQLSGVSTYIDSLKWLDR